ncbi:hypothetical protein [Neobacillus sp. D3-1R]|uniref:hypothetical protein n=1 Tax=Neobacillus sp. D3-1R TaxID=3445778 RepID=UPI003F9FFFC9
MKSLKTKALEWIVSLKVHEKTTENIPYYFKLEAFADEPEVYIRTTDEGLEFGFEATQWVDGHTPAIGKYKKYTVRWEDLESLSKEEKQQMILDLLMKTINSRKRQYRKCQFCGENVPVEHRFDRDTCHGCASSNFGVLY